VKRWSREGAGMNGDSDAMGASIQIIEKRTVKNNDWLESLKKKEEKSKKNTTN
jgi:hypothetical protein